MDDNSLLGSLPSDFRENDAQELSGNISNHRSIVLIGITRVGIGNFLSFFINRKDVLNNYFDYPQGNMFISVNMNDLIECDIAPFWMLTLKRVVDAVESSRISEDVKKEIRGLFLESIQLQDLFFTIDSVRLSINKIIEQGFSPTLFFIRFDRLRNSLTPEFFANLEGLRESTHQQLTYVFTSYQPFNQIYAQQGGGATQAIIYKDVYFAPAKTEDNKTLFKIYKQRYDLNLSVKQEEQFLNLVGGHLQYMQLGLIALHSLNMQFDSEESLKQYLINDERIRLQSEEIWESLSQIEQKVLLKIANAEKITMEEKQESQYLWNTNLVNFKNDKNTIFSPLFAYFVKERITEEAKDIDPEFSKKEMVFFDFLKNNINQICEREKIVETVWPESSELGISDWAIDKLAARVRIKLKSQKNNFEIQTIKTRGFKLIEA